MEIIENSGKNPHEPPFTDRGVENTDNLSKTCINKGLNDEIVKKEKSLELLFDWLQVTIQGYSIEDVIYNLFKVTKESCLHTPSGRFGYNNTYTYGEKIHIMYHDMRSEMGVHLLLSGSACRQIEELIGWKILFERILFHKVVKFTRIDIAIDCYKKYFDVPMLRRKLKKSELVSKFKKGTYMEQIRVSDGKQESASLKFGSMSSEIYIVFYDKLSERKNAGYTIDDNVDFWVRCELRFKNDLATKIATLYIDDNYSIGTYVQEVLYNYIDFKVYNKDKNKNRWKTCTFWSDFLGVVEKKG